MLQVEKPIALQLNESSICYLKADNHPGIFCFVSKALNPQELGFLDAAKLFKATVDEKPIKLHELHYTQAQTAYGHFKSEAIQSNFTDVTKKHISPAENKAITNINFAVKNAPTPQKKEILKKVTKAIESGTFNSKGLPKAINDFFTQHTNLFTAKPLEFYDKFFTDIIDRYNFNITSKVDNKEQERSIINPKIVLTVSIK